MSIKIRLVEESSLDDALVKYGLQAMDLFRDETPEERAIAVASTVGRQAKRKGYTEDQLSRWLQSAYGQVWVRGGNLNPGADLKVVRRWMLKAFNMKTK